MKNMGEPLGVKEVVVLYKTTIGRSLLPLLVSSHSKSSHTKPASTQFSILHILNIFSSNRANDHLYLTLQPRSFSKTINSSSNSKVFVCNEHLKSAFLHFLLSNFW